MTDQKKYWDPVLQRTVGSAQTSEERWAQLEDEEQKRQAKRWNYLSRKEVVRIGFFESGNIYEADSPSTMLYLDEIDRLAAAGKTFVYEESGKPCTAAELRSLFG